MTTPSSNNARPAAAAPPPASEAGFSLLEAVVAISVLTVGLLGVAAAIAYSTATTGRTRDITQAKQIILSTLEQVSVLRDSERLSFAQIGNGSQGNFTGFVSTFRQVSNDPGPDGIHGTADDVAQDDDPTNDSFKRSIVVSTLNTNLKKIEVTVQYKTGGFQSELSGVSYVNNDARPNYRR
jgi:type II secretory pathway pseudopilin PulG